MIVPLNVPFFADTAPIAEAKWRRKGAKKAIPWSSQGGRPAL